MKPAIAWRPNHDPSDYLATVDHLMGFSPETHYQDVEGRLQVLSRGRVVNSILA